MAHFSLTIKDLEPPSPQKMSINITRLSRKTGYSVSHLSRVFTKETGPSVRCLVKLAKALNLKLDDLHRLMEKDQIHATKNC